MNTLEKMGYPLTDYACYNVCAEILPRDAVMAPSSLTDAPNPQAVNDRNAALGARIRAVLETSRVGGANPYMKSPTGWVTIDRIVKNLGDTLGVGNGVISTSAVIDALLHKE